MKISVVIRRVQRSPWPLGQWAAAVAQGLAERGHTIEIVTRRVDDESAAPDAHFVSMHEPEERLVEAGGALLAWKRFARTSIGDADRALSMDPRLPLDVWMPAGGGAVEAFFPHRTPKWLALLRKATRGPRRQPSRRSLAGPARILTFARARAEALARWTHDGERRVTSIGFGSACEPPADPARVRHETRASLGIGRDCTLALLFAPAPSREAELLVVDAFREATARLRTRPELLIVSPASLGAALRARRLGATRVHAVGPTRRLADLIVASDVVAAPGLARRTSGEAIVVDAIRLGAPVVAARRMESAELLLPGAEGAGPGVVVEQPTPEAWRRALEQALDPDRLATLRAAARRSPSVALGAFVERLDAALLEHAPAPRIIEEAP